MSGPDKPRYEHLGNLPGAGEIPPGDRRLRAPSFDRNLPPLLVHLTPWLKDLKGPVLEIGSGTGQHAAAFALAFPDIHWWPSEFGAEQRVSISAWQAALNAPARAPFALDASGPWADDVTHLGPLRALVSMNVIHISPIAVAHGIIAGAAQTLAPGGILIFYGPFKEDGKHTGAGNESFDQGLRAKNPSWGVRDRAEITGIARQAGLEPADFIVMPSNNRLLIFRAPGTPV